MFAILHSWHDVWMVCLASVVLTVIFVPLWIAIAYLLRWLF